MINTGRTKDLPIYEMLITLYDGFDEELAEIEHTVRASSVTEAYAVTEQWVEDNEAEIPEHHDFLVSHLPLPNFDD